MIKPYLIIITFPVLMFSFFWDFNGEPAFPESSFKIKFEQKDSFHLKEGDLLFQDSDCGPFCEAIEKVTIGVNHAKFSHIGLVVKNQNGELVVLEAISKGVIETPVRSFLTRSFDTDNNPKVVVGRIKTGNAHLIRPAIDSARLRTGKAYDEIFDINNDEYYCSELIYLAFKEANGGHPLFKLEPMTFNDPDTNEPFPIWVDYYKKLGVAIPEDQPGLNPGSISRSDCLEIVHYYGQPDVK